MSQKSGGTGELILETSVEPVESLTTLREEMAELRSLVKEHQAELVSLRAFVGTATTSTKGRRVSGQSSGRASSRRSLLKWGGAAAAAAAVALAAGEQSTRAAPANNGDPITAGTTTTASSPTILSANVSSTAFAVTAPNNALAINGTAFGTGTGIGVAGNGGDAGQGVHGESGLYGVYGLSFANGFGVYGTDTSTNGIGVYGTGALYGVEGVVTNAETGVYGSAGNGGNGAQCVASGSLGYGVWGLSDSGYGVVGDASTGIDLAASGSGRVWQALSGSPGAPTSGSHAAGEQIRDENSDLYICVMSGSPGIWKKVTAIPAGARGGASVFFATPYRIFDTRDLAGVPFNNGAGNHPMTPSQIRTLQITGTVDPNDSSIVVPAGATGIIGNLIAITPAGEGFLGIQPSTGSPNSRAWVNYEANVSIDNAVLVGLSSDGKIDIQCNTANAGAALTITGYFI